MAALCWRPAGAPAPGLPLARCRGSCNCSDAVVDMLDLYRLIKGGAAGVTHADAKYQSWLATVRGWGVQSAMHGLSHKHVRFGDALLMLVLGSASKDAVSTWWAMGAKALLNSAGRRLLAPPAAQALAPTPQEGPLTPFDAAGCATIDEALKFVHEEMRLAKDDGAFRAKMRLLARRDVGSWRVTGPEGAPRELRLLFRACVGLASVTLEPNAGSIKEHDKMCTLVGRYVGWQLFKHYLRTCRDPLPLPLPTQLGLFLEMNGAKRAVQELLRRLGLAIDATNVDDLLDKWVEQFDWSVFRQLGDSWVHSVDNANLLRNIALTQASGAAARLQAAIAKPAAYDADRAELAAATARLEQLRARDEPDEEAMDEEEAEAEEAASAEERTLQARADQLTASLAPSRDLCVLKETYNACGCAKECDTGSCSCRKANEPCGPGCGCAAGCCKAPLSRLVFDAKRAQARGAAPRPVAVLNETTDKNYETIDWIHNTMTRVPTIATSEFPDAAPQAPVAERTPDKALGPMHAVMTLQAAARANDATCLVAALRAKDESAPAAGPPSAAPPPAAAAAASAPLACGVAACRGCPPPAPFTLPAPGSATERAARYEPAAMGRLPPATAAVMHVLPVEQFANPNDPVAMHQAVAKVDEVLSHITGGAKPRMPPPASGAAPGGADDETEGDDAMDDDSAPAAARRLPHCSICGHAGTKKSHDLRGCKLCGVRPGTACIKDSPVACDCASHKADAAAADKAAADKAAIDHAFVPPLPWCSFFSNFNRLLPSLTPRLNRLAELLEIHSPYAADGTVTTGWGAVRAAAGEAVRVYALAAGGGPRASAREAEAAKLLDAAIAAAQALDPQQRSIRRGGGPPKLYSGVDAPLYALQRLYLMLRGEMGKRLILPGGLHVKISLAETIGHCHELLGIRELLKSSVSLRTDGQVEYIEHARSDVANALEVHRMILQAIKIHLFKRFLDHPPDVAAAACAALRRSLRVELVKPRGATDMWLGDVCEGLDADQAPAWLQAVTAEGAVVTVRCGARSLSLASQPEAQRIAELRAFSAACCTVADAAEEEVITQFHIWLKRRCDSDPTLRAWAQYASIIFLTLKYHEYGRAGPAMADVRNFLSAFNTLIFASDVRKKSYRPLSITHAMDMNLSWTANEKEGLMYASTHALTDSETGGHDVDEDEKEEDTVGDSKESCARSGQATRNTVSRTMPNCKQLKQINTLIREQASVRTSGSHFSAKNEQQVLELVARLEEVDLVAERTTLVNVFTDEEISAEDAEGLPFATTQHAIAVEVHTQFDDLVALEAGPPPQGREVDPAKRAVDVPVDVPRLLAQAADKAAKAPQPRPARAEPGTAPATAPRKRRAAGSRPVAADVPGSAAAATFAAREKARKDKQLVGRIHGGPGTAATTEREGAEAAADTAAMQRAATALGGFVVLGATKCPGCGARVSARTGDGFPCGLRACCRTCCLKAQRDPNRDLGACILHLLPPDDEMT